MSTDMIVEDGSTATTAKEVAVTSTSGGTMVSSQDNNNNQCTSQPINMNNIQYTPELLSRYIHYYKTGQDINNPNISSTNNTTEQPPKKKKKRNKKLKHIPPLQLSTRRTIQNCCKTSNLSLALITFYNALNDLVYIDGSVFYQLLNLCESGSSGDSGDSGGDSSGDLRKKIHVGTPKNSKRDDKVQGVNSSDITEATNSNSSSIKITLKERIQHATTIHKLLSSLQIPLIEQAYTALIRLSVRNNNYKQAEEYLKEAESTQQCKVKLRLYSTLLRGYCGDIPSSSSTSDDVDDDDFSSKDEKQENKYNNKPTKEGLIKALATWKRLYDNSGGMSTGHPNYAKLNSNNSNNSKLASADNGKSADSTSTNDKNSNKNQKQIEETLLFGEGISPKITLSEVEYTSLLKAATTLHDTKVIERILSNVSDEIQIPGRECRDAIVNWFLKDTDTNDKDMAEDDVATESQSALDEVTLPPSEVDLTSFNSVTNGSGWSIYDNCSIDTTTGQLTLPNTTNTTPSEVCNDEDGSQHTNLMYKLKPVELSTKSWKSMTNMNRTIVLNGSITGNVSKFQGGGKGNKRPRGGTNKGVSEVHGTNSSDRKSKSWTVKDNDSTTSTDEKKLNEKEEKKDKPQSNWRINAWNNFEKFIEEHPPYNVVIDGANVG